MSDEALVDLARRAGLQVQWEDAAGRDQTVADDALRAVLQALGLPAGSAAEIADSSERLRAEDRELPRLVTADAGRPIELPQGIAAGRARLVLEEGEARDVTIEAGSRPRTQAIDRPGYHRLQLGDREMVLAVAPAKAFTVADAAPGRRMWGAGVQLYSLREERPTGFGDFGALARFAETLGRRGADAVAISPVHALFAADPERYGPYAPSSRLFLNGLYADPSAALGQAAATGGAEPAPALIDWKQAWPAKLERLRALHRAFRENAEPGRRNEFDAFCKAGGADLRAHALFEALHGRFFLERGACGWPDWPTPFQDPASPEVAAFARDNAEEVDLHLFLQWLADRSLAAAQAAARGSGMAIGLIADLAVGMDLGGSHGWSRRGDLITGLNVGAPPDLLGPAGQDWGISAFSPKALRKTGFEGFIATLRAAMAHAGGVRIDHAMGLQRLWLVPRGSDPAHGAYLCYPRDDLLRLLALESLRARAVVIAEDLGTVPPGFSESLRERGLMGMQVLWFERDGDGFKAPRDWNPGSVALTSTHDLPTVAGWWRERDIDWTFALKRKSPYASEADARQARSGEREALWRACRESGIAEGDAPPKDEPGPAVDAALAFVARTPSPLALIQAEDLFGLEEQPNLPATTSEHPNWRRRLPGPPDALLEQPSVTERVQRLSAERPRGAP